MSVFSTAAKLAFILTAIAVLLCMVWWSGKLPDVVPSHFDLQGNPDDTMQKNAYMGLMYSVHILQFALFGFMAFAMPKSPDSIFNMPNKAYWLAPERRDNTKQEMQSLLLGHGTLTMIFVGILFHLSSQVAIKQRATISPEFAWMLGIYLVANVGMIIWMLRKFRLPADATE